jgi:hypothetical protein
MLLNGQANGMQNGADHAAATVDWPILNARFRRSRASDGSLR